MAFSDRRFLLFDMSFPGSCWPLGSGSRCNTILAIIFPGGSLGPPFSHSSAAGLDTVLSISQLK